MFEKLDIVEIDRGSQLLEQISRLRASVWVDLGASPELFQNGMWTDNHDVVCGRHWIALDAGSIVGAARLCIHSRVEDFPAQHIFCQAPLDLPSPFGLISRLVIKPEYRRRSLASRFDQLRIEAAKKAGCATLMGYVSNWSGPSRLSSLINLGFKPLPTMRGIRDWEDTVDVVALDLGKRL